jgi:hypothetical protein
MAQVCIGIGRNRREKNYGRLAQGVGGVDRNIQRGIVDAALSPLHPVDNTCSIPIGRAASPHGNSWILRNFSEFVHHRRAGSRVGQQSSRRVV